MQPTDEQQAVLNDGNRIIRINARAGTGKTTTLQMLSAKDRTAKILYLVFNRKAREEAKEKFPSNVEVHTVHSLAYRHEGYKWNGQLKDFGPLDMLPSFRRFGKPHLLATIAHGFLTFFLNSPHRMLEDAVAEFPGILPRRSEGGSTSTIKSVCWKLPGKLPPIGIGRTSRARTTFISKCFTNPVNS